MTIEEARHFVKSKRIINKSQHSNEKHCFVQDGFVVIEQKYEILTESEQTNYSIK